MLVGSGMWIRDRVGEQRGANARASHAGNVFFQKFVAEMVPRAPVKSIFPKGTVEINGIKYDRFDELTGAHFL